MTDTPNTPDTPQNPDADRIAKVIARAGVASRREAERMIIEGRVTVNGQKITSPALDVLPTDRVTVDGKKLDAPQETRMWLYYKPIGLVTSESDEKGRQTVFDALPRDLPRVMTVGRLDLNSEGLLLLTNDGELKRRLELPQTGWLRRYRVRVNGQPNDLTFDPLRRGVTIDGEEFAPMEIKLDSQQGANAWLTVGIREGKNREIRRAMAHVGLQVNRLIRIGYGPFKLIGMEKNEVVEVKRRVLRDQLGGLLTGEVEEKEREMRPRGAGSRGDGDRPRFPRRDDGDRPRRDDGDKPRRFGNRDDRPFRSRDDGDKPRFPRRDDGDRPRRDDGDKPRRFGNRDDARPFRPREDGDRPRFPRRDEGDRPRRDDGDKPRRSFGGKPDGDRPRRFDGPRDGQGRDGQDGGRRFGKPDGQGGDRPRFGGKPGPRRDGDGSRRDFAARDGQRDGERKPRHSGKPGEARKPWGDKPRSDDRAGDRPGGFRGKPGGDRPFNAGGKPGGKPGGFGGRPGGKPGGKPGGRPGGKPRD
ncbi:pseudouridine synthase [Paracoccus sp. (in: a-proteobacteria)]|uniref:pseudouridine synthase n=1 Tax=Paracoccus sp. TaxID=267 RepID=UPI0026E00FCC|nr:pseudouridine synthase [Paracoccus sp. (in: a-proteobacteria)]MDO5647840.1 pseudouridine synthase [Paracoccus sp. (in: a-proteobacteria)]